MTRIFLQFVIIMLISQAALAQVNFYTLDEVLGYAREKSVVARQAKQAVNAAAEDVNIQRSGLLPKVNAFGTADYYPIIATQVIPESIFGGSPDKFTKVQFGLPFAFTAGAELSVPVLNFGKWAQLQKSRLQLDQTTWARNTDLETISIQLTRLYYQELAMKSALALNNQNKEIAARLMKIMDDRKASGILDPADYNRSRNLELDVKKQGVEYERLINEARNNIRTLLNLSDSVAYFIIDSLPQFSWPIISRQADDVSGRPAWKEVNSRVLVAEKSLEESRKNYYPSLSFYSRYVYNWQMKFKDDVSVNFDVSTIGARLDIPIFQGGYHRSMQRKSNYQLESAKLEKEKVYFNLLQQQKEWNNNYRKAFEQHTVLSEKTTVADDNLRIAALNLKEGLIEFNIFNEIFLEYNRARLEYIQNLLDGILYYHLLTKN